MKRFIIKVSTNWCGMNASYRAVANDGDDLCEFAQDLAYDNFESYDGASLMAESEGYDPEDMKEHDWNRLYEDVDESDYYSYYIEAFEGTDEEWEEIGGEIYGEEC